MLDKSYMVVSPASPLPEVVKQDIATRFSTAENQFGPGSASNLNQISAAAQKAWDTADTSSGKTIIPVVHGWTALAPAYETVGRAWLVMQRGKTAAQYSSRTAAMAAAQQVASTVQYPEVIVVD